jgi:hypothetical protein
LVYHVKGVGNVIHVFSTEKGTKIKVYDEMIVDA